MHFYDSTGVFFGSKNSLCDLLVSISGRPEDYLLRRRNLREASVARRMSWAPMRETIRVEDIAYCLLGIFDVNMPLLYGGGTKAFVRLQQACSRKVSPVDTFHLHHDLHRHWLVNTSAIRIDRHTNSIVVGV